MFEWNKVNKIRLKNYLRFYNAFYDTESVFFHFEQDEYQMPNSENSICCLIILKAIQKIKYYLNEWGVKRINLYESSSSINDFHFLPPISLSIFNLPTKPLFN
jgi:hypothetical protein